VLNHYFREFSISVFWFLYCSRQNISFHSILAARTKKITHLKNLLFLCPRAFISVAEKKPKGLNYTALDKNRLLLFKQELVCVFFPLSIDAMMLIETC